MFRPMVPQVPRHLALGVLLMVVAACAVAVWAAGLTPLPSAPAQSSQELQCPSPAADQCTGPVYNQVLRQPRTIRSDGDVLETSLTVEKHVYDCVPFWNSAAKDWQWCRMTLRSYGAPAEEDPSNLEFSFPGPTYRVRKALLRDATKEPGPDNPQTQPGTRLKVLLENRLPNNSVPPHDCAPAHYQACQKSKDACTQGDDGRWTCTSDPNQSCVDTPIPQAAPNCFHGPDVTNFHLHGSHVSPQPFQDFVLLSLYSSLQNDPPPPCTPPDCPADIAVGEYPINVNPFPWNQAPGTHWYHPHKHGATALQVLNGMAGALLVAGPFDAWLYHYYHVNPENRKALETFEKVLVVQEVYPELPFYTNPPPSGFPPAPLINGQANPMIRMRPGEVQRWRFIGATMQNSAQIKFSFPQGYKVKQIAQDGVQFARENYVRQPLYQNGSLTLSPGNRADFLVEAPPVDDNIPDPVLFQVVGVPEAAGIGRRAAGQPRLGRQVTGLEETNKKALFTIDLVGRRRKMALPPASEWPPMPYYLRDVEGDDLPERTIAYSMTNPKTGKPTEPGTQPNGVWINKVQYKSGCANETMILATAERWTLTNDNSLAHPFHIHTNPFQLSRYDETTFQKPYVWMDTVALPTTDNPYSLVSAEILHRFEDYSGPYVNHCHFLGHEDRGMMINLQALCAETEKYGTPRPNGGADDCSVPSQLFKPNPLPECKTSEKAYEQGH